MPYQQIVGYRRPSTRGDARHRSEGLRRLECRGYDSWQQPGWRNYGLELAEAPGASSATSEAVIAANPIDGTLRHPAIPAGPRTAASHRRERAPPPRLHRHPRRRPQRHRRKLTSPSKKSSPPLATPSSPKPTPKIHRPPNRARNPRRKRHRSRRSRPPSSPPPHLEAFAIGVLSAHEPNKLVAARNWVHPLSSPASATANTSSPPTSPASSTTPPQHPLPRRAANWPSSPPPASSRLTNTEGKPAPPESPAHRLGTPSRPKRPATSTSCSRRRSTRPAPRPSADTTTAGATSRSKPAKSSSPQSRHHPSDDEFRRATQITIAACGTSWHAGLAGKFMIERLARLPRRRRLRLPKVPLPATPSPGPPRHRPPHHPVR